MSNPFSLPWASRDWEALAPLHPESLPKWWEICQSPVKLLALNQLRSVSSRPTWPLPSQYLPLDAREASISSFLLPEAQLLTAFQPFLPNLPQSRRSLPARPAPGGKSLGIIPKSSTSAMPRIPFIYGAEELDLQLWLNLLPTCQPLIIPFTKAAKASCPKPLQTSVFPASPSALPLPNHRSATPEQSRQNCTSDPTAPLSAVYQESPTAFKIKSLLSPSSSSVFLDHFASFRFLPC